MIYEKELRNEKFSKRFISELQTLPMAQSDLSVLSIPARYNPYLFVKIRYSI